jgi:hypothetical protein
MSALNKNNPNGGSKGADSAISKLVPENVSVTSPDHQPENRALAGKTFLGGSPAGREAKPQPKIDGGNPILS